MESTATEPAERDAAPHAAPVAAAELDVGQFRELAARIQAEVGKVMVGQSDIVRDVLICIVAGGHALIEGVPGLGKTRLVRTLAETLDLDFSRIQFTPDLMPADITGTNILVEDEQGRRQFAFQRGPVFANFVLADEINRATPKTQSALLEAMQDKTVTVSNRMHVLEPPFFVLATQNPLEMEGTYPLPEAQLDRFFFKLVVPYPNAADLKEILRRTTANLGATPERAADGAVIAAMGRLAREVPIAQHVSDFVVRLLLSTHPENDDAPDVVKRFVQVGASPRGGQAMVLGSKILALLDGRLNVSLDDIRSVAYPALRHRLILNFNAAASRVGGDEVIRQILAGLPDSAA